MGSSKPKTIQTPYAQQQQTQNTYSLLGPYGTQEAKDLLSTPLDFGGGNYGGEAYKDIKTDFDIDPGVGRRTDLAEQAAQNRWNSAFMKGIPQEYRQLQRDSEMRQIRGQGAAERQQAEYARQQAEANAIAQRAQMRDASELARAQMGDQAATQRTMAELERRRLMLPQIVQTGGSGSTSGYNTQVVQPQPGFFSQLAGGLVGGLAGGFGSGIGGKLATAAGAIPFI